VVAKGAMIISEIGLEDQLAALKTKAFDAFSKQAMEGAQHALANAANPLRLNFFSAAMRILYEHMMGVLAPIEQVKQCSWFVEEREDKAPTRGQRIAFAIQGGLDDDFVKNALSLDLTSLRKKLLGAVDDLSKHIHGREDTIILDMAAQNAAAKVTIEALDHFFEVYRDCRSAILDPTEEKLDEAYTY
jgi:hypothetical protein